MNTKIASLALQKFEQLLPNIDCLSKHIQVSSVVRAQPEAAQWLLTHKTYVSWKASYSLSRLLWLNGIPGAGKTVLCSRVIDDIRRLQSHDPGVNLVLFYCTPASNPKDVFGSLLRQLLSFIPPNSPVLSDILKQHELAQSVDELPLVDLIIEFSGELGRSFVAIDGLEECQDLPIMLLELTRLAEELDIFVCSRDHPDIRAELGVYERITISRNDIMHDVQRYVDLGVNGLQMQDTQLSKSIVGELVDGAQGTFLWPASQLRALEETPQGSITADTLKIVPPEMAGMITQALETIDSKSHSRLCRSILHLVLCARWPITLGALVEVIETLKITGAYTPVDATSFVDDCGHLLISVPVGDKDLYKYYWHDRESDEDWDHHVSDHEYFLIPFHPTLKTFLLADPVMLPPSLASYSLLPQEPIHDALARLCLTHLNRLLKDANHKTILKSSDHPFTEYALHHWLTHAHASGKTIQNFRELLTPWRSNKTREWVPSFAHMAVRLNMPSIQGLSEAMFTVVDDIGLSPLHVALKNSAPSAILDWVLKKADVNQVTEDRFPATALHLAAMYHREPKPNIQRLLEAGANMNARTKQGRTALHLLLEWQSPERAALCLPVLLRFKVDIHAQDAHLRTPLHSLARCAQQSNSTQFLLEYLVQHGARLDARDKQGKTPLHLATQSGNALLVASMLLNGADVNAVDDCGDTPLSVALRVNAEDVSPLELVLQYLLDHGADVNYTRKDSGSSLLHDAARSGHASTVAFLLDKGAQPDPVDNEFWTPLHVACGAPSSTGERSGHGAVVKLLLDQGANVNTRNKDGETPLHCAVIKANEEVTAQLLAHNADVNALDRHKRTPLHNAAQWGRSSIIELLLKEKAAVDMKAFGNETPLHVLCRCIDNDYYQRQSKNYENAITQLLNSGANIHSPNFHGDTPLVIAAENGRASLVAVLLQLGAGADSMSLGRSLVEAIYWGETKGPERESYEIVIQQLLARGIDIHRRYGPMASPLDLAKGAGYDYAVRLMMRQKTATWPAYSYGL